MLLLVFTLIESLSTNLTKLVYFSVITGFETNNKYEIKNAMGQRVYFAAEENDCCTRNCCGPSRPFTIKIIDNIGQEVITLQRPLRCSSCCCPCCLQEVSCSFLSLSLVLNSFGLDFFGVKRGDTIGLISSETFWEISSVCVCQCFFQCLSWLLWYLFNRTPNLVR